jgi:hypothetical protein
MVSGTVVLLTLVNADRGTGFDVLVEDVDELLSPEEMEEEPDDAEDV